MLDSTKPDLNAREAYQILKDIALGVRAMQRTSKESFAELHSGVMAVDVDGWKIAFFIDSYELDYCEQCTSPDGRFGSFDTWHRFGTNPIQLLSAWERQQFEGFIKDL